MEDKPESSIPFATGGIVKGPLHGVIACSCGGAGYLIPPKRTQDDTIEPYDERESSP
jgi:hypothetical protein